MMLGALAAQAAAGDPASLERLLEELYVPVRDYYRGWLARRPDADDLAQDLTQEAMVSLVRGIARCRARTDGQVMAWGLSIARSRALDYLRSERRDVTAGAEGGEVEELTAAASLEAWRGGEEEGEGSSLTPELEALARFHDALPEPTQQVLWHRLVLGADWNEVAAETGLTHRTVQRRYQRVQEAARAALRGRPGRGAPGARDQPGW